MSSKPSPNPSRIAKPKHNFKSSDRRLASMVRPESFLHSEQSQALNNRSVSPTVYQSRPQANKNSNTQEEPTWDPKHFRLFVGNLGSDGSDALLLKYFSQYPSLAKVHVPLDAKGENKGYGFVSFKEAGDYLKCFKEWNGKFVGHNPVVLKRATGGVPGANEKRKGNGKIKNFKGNKSGNN